MTNFEKWKESLMIDEASDILGDLATENEECPIGLRMTTRRNR